MKSINRREAVKLGVIAISSIGVLSELLPGTAQTCGGGGDGGMGGELCIVYNEEGDTILDGDNKTGLNCDY